MSTSFPAPPRRRPGLRSRLVGAALALLPVAELAVAIAVGRAIGAGWTLLLLFAGCVAGAVVLRRVGLSAVRRPAAGEPTVASPAEPPVARALLVVAGLLLLLPGFLSDAAGLVLLVPAVRRALSLRMGAAIARRFEGLRGVRVVQGSVLPGDGVPVQVTVVDGTDPLFTERPRLPRAD